MPGDTGGGRMSPPRSAWKMAEAGISAPTLAVEAALDGRFGSVRGRRVAAGDGGYSSGRCRLDHEFELYDPMTIAVRKCCLCSGSFRVRTRFFPLRSGLERMRRDCMRPKAMRGRGTARPGGALCGGVSISLAQMDGEVKRFPSCRASVQTCKC